MTLPPGRGNLVSHSRSQASRALSDNGGKLPFMMDRTDDGSFPLRCRMPRGGCTPVNYIFFYSKCHKSHKSHYKNNGNDINDLGMLLRMTLVALRGGLPTSASPPGHRRRAALPGRPSIKNTPPGPGRRPLGLDNCPHSRPDSGLPAVPAPSMPLGKTSPTRAPLGDATDPSNCLFVV